jgi:hypothetical protein
MRFYASGADGSTMGYFAIPASVPGWTDKAEQQNNHELLSKN